MKCKTLRPFVNRFTAYGKYSVVNTQYLQHRIHMQLSQKRKTFSEFFSGFLKCRSNFEHIKKKMTLIANVIVKLKTPKNAVRKMSKKCRLTVTFNKQYGKRARTLLKSERRQFYQIY